MSFRIFAAETMGTFWLVFCGTGAMIIDAMTGGAVTHLGVSLTFGLIVLAMIIAFGDVSGAHLNPAVTVGFWLSRALPGRRVPAMIAAQCIGAIAASAALHALFPGSATLGETLPSRGAMQSFILEILLTALLMLVIIRVSTAARESGLAAALVIGGVITMEAIFGGPISGASMNPARSLGPALISGQMDSLWIYFTAPFIGAVLGAGTARILDSKR